MPEPAPTSPTDAVGEGGENDTGRPSWWWWLLLAVVVLPVLGAGWQRHHDGWFPEGDDATIVLLSHDTFSRHPTLVGMRASAPPTLDDPHLYHPGPLEMYGLAPFTHLGSASTAATTLAVVVFNAIVVAGFGLTLRRLGGDALGAAGLLAAGLVVWSMGGDAPASVWNPYVAALPFVLLLVLAAATASGHRRLLPWVLAVGSFVIQAHLGYVGLAGSVMVWAVATVAWDSWRNPTIRAEARRLGTWSAGVLGLLWAAPIVQQITSQPGNLTQILRSSLAPGQASAGTSGLAQLASVMGRPLLGWAPDADLVRVVPTFGIRSLALLLVPVLGTALMGSLAHRRGDQTVVRVLATVAVILVATAVTATKIPVEGAFSYQHYAFWMRPAAITVWLLLVWAGVRLFGEGAWWAPPVPGRLTVPLLLAIGIGISGLPRPGAWEPWTEYRTVAGEVVPAVVDDVGGNGSAVVRFRGGTAYLSTGSAVVLGLEEAGVSVDIDPGFAGDVFPWGERRRDVGRPVDAEVWVVSGPPPADLPPGARSLVEVEILSPAERAAAEADARALREALAIGIVVGPRSPVDDQDRTDLREAQSDPLAAYDRGLITRLALRGLIEPPGGDLNRLVTVDRLRAMATEDTVTVYLVDGS